MHWRTQWQQAEALINVGASAALNQDASIAAVDR
jgi:hypothetical protein